LTVDRQRVCEVKHALQLENASRPKILEEIAKGSKNRL
jgi:hypothetical protein